MSATAAGLRGRVAFETHATEPQPDVVPPAVNRIHPTEFVQTHFAFVWRTLRRFGVPESEAQDAAQRVFVIATDRLDRIQPKKERAFLFGTAVRIADKVRRSQARKPVVSESDPDGEPSPWPSADELVDQRRARAVLDSILDGMSVNLRAVFVLYEIEQMTVNDIANVLEIPVGTAASRLRRARELSGAGAGPAPGRKTVSDPQRFSDDSDRALALLLRAGQDEVPTRHALEKTIAGIGAATTVIGASQTAGAAVTAGKLGVWTLAKWAGAGVLSGVITVGGVELVQQGIEASQNSAAETSAVTAKPAPRGAVPRHETTSLAVQEPAQASESAPTLEPHGQSPSDRRQVAQSGERPGVRVKPSGLLEPGVMARSEPGTPQPDTAISIEVGLLDEARRALQAGHAASALQALARHRTEVKQKRLAPEAQYLEMEALFQAGNTTAAKAAARGLLARYAKGPHAARAQAILER